MSFNLFSMRAVLPLILVALSGCAQSGGGTSLDAKKVNLDIQSLSKDGCLNLQLLKAHLDRLPEAARVRRVTTSFEMTPVNADDAIRRGFLALNSFSNYIYSETSGPAAMREMGEISQTGCESVAFSNDLEGTKTYNIVPPVSTADEPANTEAPQPALRIQSDDGMDVTWTILGDREIEITTKSLVMDPCPLYVKANATSVVRVTWGSESEIAAKPVKISRGYLRAMSTAVTNMPDGLLGLATNSSTDELVSAAASDLARLQKATVDPQIHQCPYRANPPSGDEPPPSNGAQPAEPGTPDA